MRHSFEWPTLAFLLMTYAVWAAATVWLATVSMPLAVVVAALAIAQHSSLQHEMMHGHPFRDPRLNAALVFPALILVIPYLRFRDTHLAHHQDSRLTDPYDDPESNYLDAGAWERLPAWGQRLLNLNNTLAGRMVLGPVIGTLVFLMSEVRTAQSDARVLRGWLWHAPMVLPVIVWVLWSPMPFWAYALAVYLALALLRIRTFLEHQAHEQARARSVIIEDRGPLALLFLNNNLHVVHHMHPRVPWYRLPALYRENAVRYRRVNEGYVFRSYAEVFRRYFLSQKDPVPHPLWRRRP
ncbi:fatty acid desaturase [Silicimonas sp. MF1-12-2]|uniref:fatty acid desaturase n=1 Tax=Silicimonas sp. MF1-12-2 TaxID=3384793 RepID=UPI0039B678FB